MMSPSTRPGNALSMQRLKSNAEHAFGELLRIYAASIPASERKSAKQLAAMVARPDYCFLVTLEADAVAGFSIAVNLSGTDAALLEYMAVAPEQRGRGVGAWLFRATAEQPPLAGRFLLVEVDSDRTDSPDHAERVRRKTFYRRLGAKEIDGLCYRMPRVSSAFPPSMDLLLYREELPSFLEKSRVRTWLERCYQQVYGVAEDDPQIESMIAGLPEQIALI